MPVLPGVDCKPAGSRRQSLFARPFDQVILRSPNFNTPARIRSRLWYRERERREFEGLVVAKSHWSSS
jgi:hypothetical protein